MNDETKDVSISLRSKYFGYDTFLENIAKPFVDLAIYLHIDTFRVKLLRFLILHIYS